MQRNEELAMLRDISKIARSLERIARIYEKEEREKICSNNEANGVHKKQEETK